MKSKANLLIVVVLICLATSCATAKPSADEPRGRDMTTHTELTPQALLDRLFSLIENVESFDELSPLLLEKYLEVPFTKSAGENSGFYTLDQPAPYSGYGITYNFDKKFTQYSNVTLELLPPSSIPLSTTPPCELAFEQYDRALKDAGFKAELGLYNEFGWILSFQYSRKNIRAQINPWHPASPEPQQASVSCVKSISLHKIEE